MLSRMTLADDILSLVTRKPGLSEVEIARNSSAVSAINNGSTLPVANWPMRIASSVAGMVAQGTRLSIIGKGSWILPSSDHCSRSRYADAARNVTL